MRSFYLIAAVAALFLVSPSRAELICGESVERPELFQVAYSMVPESVKAHPVYLEVRPMGSKHGKIAFGEAVVITVTNQKAVRSFLHELGHLAHSGYNAALDYTEWLAWGQIFEQRKGKMPKSPSGDSRRNVYEGFAESFMKWVLGKKLHPEIQAWFDAAF